MGQVLHAGRSFFVGSAVAATLVGLVMYGEKLNSVQIAGVIVGIVAIALISFGEEM